MARITADTLFVGVDSDWLYPPGYLKEMTYMMKGQGKNAEYKEIKSPHGHDAFLIEFNQMERIVRDFLENLRT